MKYVHNFTRYALTLLCICSLLLTCVFAADLPADREYQFSGTEFGEDAAACGLFIAETPDEECCGLYLGDRRICAGDFLPAQALPHLILRPCRDEDAQITVTYRPVCDGQLREECQFTMTIASTRDDPPEAQDGKLQTYRNIANTGNLHANDPEGLALTYRIEDYPKRGTVELKENGSFVYTPKKNKVGNDCFTFTAADPAGNVSEVKTVQIEILKPSDAATFSDLDASAQFAGMWMRTNGLYGGEMLADRLCFCTEKEVTRGEFLVMAMQLADIQPEIGLLSSGFCDQESAPKWMQNYLVSAMRRGIVSGVPTAGGLAFEPNRPITAEEAAAIVCRICNIEKSQTVSTEENDLPVWQASSMQAVRSVGLPVPESGKTVTRIDAARLLYEIKNTVE